METWGAWDIYYIRVHQSIHKIRRYSRWEEQLCPFIQFVRARRRVVISRRVPIHGLIGRRRPLTAVITFNRIAICAARVSTADWVIAQTGYRPVYRAQSRKKRFRDINIDIYSFHDNLSLRSHLSHSWELLFNYKRQGKTDTSRMRRKHFLFFLARTSSHKNPTSHSYKSVLITYFRTLFETERYSNIWEHNESIV